MSRELVSPNLHVVLIHFPIGLFLMGMVIELFSFAYRTRPIRAAGRWMIVIGALLMIPAALTGAYAIADLTRRALPAPDQLLNRGWNDVLAISPLHLNPDGTESPVWTTLAAHAWREGPATALAAIVVMFAIGLSDRWRRRLYIPGMLLLLFCAAVMVWGAWHGGEAVFQHGVGVRANRVELLPSTNPTTLPALLPTPPTRPALEWVLPPLEAHLIAAGIAIAFVFGAIGMSWRASHPDRQVAAGEEEARLIEGLPIEPGRRPNSSTDLALIRSFRPSAALVVPPDRTPATAVWMLTFVAVLLAAVAGAWYLARVSWAFTRAGPEHRPATAILWEQVVTPISTIDPSGNPLQLTRRYAHVISGGALLLLPLLMAALARWAAKRRLILMLLSLLLLVLLAAQLWTGILMLFDSPEGGLYKMRPATTNLVSTH